MPPAPHEYHGLEAIAGFLQASARGCGGRNQLGAARANGQPAFACFLTGPRGQASRPTGVVVLTLSGPRISTITRFLDPRLPGLFGVPRPD